MHPFIVFISLALLIHCSSANQSDDEFLSSLKTLYGTGEIAEKYFSTHGKTMFEQVSMLDSIALAKIGAVGEARDQIKSLAVQTLLAGLPPAYQAAGDLYNLMQKERSFFTNSINEGEKYLDSVSSDIRTKVSEFSATQQTDQDKERVQGEIEETLKGKTAEREKVSDAFQTDFNRLKQLAETNGPSPMELKAWHVYGHIKFMIKRLQFNPNSLGRFVGPVSDIVHIIISGMGLIDAIENSNTKGIVKSVVGIVGGLVGLAAFGFALSGFAIAGPIGMLAGVAFYILPMIIGVLWPSNVAIETANKLSEFSRKDMEAHLAQLLKFSDNGKKSYGWMYQVNAGVLITKRISPNTNIKFFQPSCANQGASPCNPKQETYANKKYLVLGQRRQSTDSRPEFSLDMPYDFIGAPTEAKFCGNTIDVNTRPYRQYVEFLLARRQRGIGAVGQYHRSIEIDTRTVPQYNDVNYGAWRRRTKRAWISHLTNRSAISDVREDCDPASDRIAVDELDRLDPNSGRITINTGEGKDVLSLNSMVGQVNSNRQNFIVSDLGEDGNLLSIGVTLGIGRKRGDLVAGVIFDNTGGNGKLCYLKEDYKTKRCVGHVKKATIFKGSRLHDTVIIGADGPFVVIQNHGANEYIIDMKDVLRKDLSGGPLRIEIMDLSGNRPVLKIRQNAGGTPTGQYRHPKDGYFMFVHQGRNAVRVDITGSVTNPDMYYVFDDGREQCLYPTEPTHA